MTDSLQVEHEVWPLVHLQDVVEELAAGAEDGLVGLHLTVVAAGQGDVGEVLVRQEVPDQTAGGVREVLLGQEKRIISLHGENVGCHCLMVGESIVNDDC